MNENKFINDNRTRFIRETNDPEESSCSVVVFNSRMKGHCLRLTEASVF